MVAEAAPKSKAAEALAALAQVLLGQEKQAKPKSSSLGFLNQLPFMRKK
jgi:Flp pilus assembly CpaE family ATPase